MSHTSASFIINTNNILTFLHVMMSDEFYGFLKKHMFPLKDKQFETD